MMHILSKCFFLHTGSLFHRLFRSLESHSPPHQCSASPSDGFLLPPLVFCHFLPNHVSSKYRKPQNNRTKIQ